MARKLAPSTMAKLRARLEDEQARLEGVIDEFDKQREQSRLAETSAEHSADPDSADGGSLAFEMEMELSKQENARELLEKVVHALRRMDEGVYGICEVSGKPIPVARLEALPYATTLVEYADRV
ncbi:MAG: TraR/DksA C4-type zinc finger protein [Acidimicrobiia bacterium]|nr:TraR/DksA C4-type zinc finger protein [Acidimicrobiia bacterium]